MQSQMKNLVRISPQQKHLWLLQEGDNSQTYCSQVAINIEGNLQPEILELALNNIIDREEILRTTFHALPGMNIPLQSIEENNKLSVVKYDWSGLTTQEQQRRINGIFDDKSLRIFDISKYPLLHLVLIKLSPNKHLLFVSLSSLCADMATLNHLVKEISHSYFAYLDDKEPSAASMQYADISEWLNELLESKDTEIGRNYWQQQDISALLTLKLPLENQNLDTTEFKPQYLTLQIDGDTKTKLKTLTEKYNTSADIILLACWQVLLFRLCGQSDIIVGTAYDGRKYEELKDVAGSLTKYLPLSSYLDQNLRFAELLDSISKSSIYINKWQEYFDWGQITLKNSQFANSQFFPFCFDFEAQNTKYTNDDISFSVYKKYICNHRFKIRLATVQENDGLFLEFHYDSSLFSGEHMKIISQQYQTLLLSALDNPQVAISNLEIISPIERQQLLIDFNNTQTPYPQDKCIHQLFEEQVERTPNKIAVEFANQHLTYAQLNMRANQLAHQLQDLGVKPEVLVGICVERSLEMLIGILGILKAGGAYMALDPTYPQQRLAFMLEDAQVGLLLTQRSLVENFVEYKTHCICLDADLQLMAGQNNHNPVSGVKPENLAYIIYTSGSTGKPKGTMIPHQGLVNYLSWCTKEYEVAQGYGAPVQSSIGFDATITSLFSPLLVGQSVVLLPENQEIEALSNLLLSENNFSLVKITPAHLEILNQLLPNQQEVTKTRALIIGGEALLGKSLAFWRKNAPHTRLINEYGPTETVVGCCVYEVDNHTSLSGAILIGRPIANTQLYVLDEDQKLLPIGVPGELYIGGAGVARGYLNRPDLTQEKLIPNPFSDEPGSRLYKTGDLVRYLPDGNLEYLGRIDHQVKIRGFRIELTEIESLLAQHPHIESVAVIAREDQPGDKRLVGYIIPKQERIPTTGELQQFLQEKLPDYMVPAAFVVLESLPLTPNGKIDRRALPAPETSRHGSKVEFVQPRDILELQLVQIWENLLDVHPIGVKDSFFDLGGHSLMAVRLMAHIQQEFGKNMPLATLLQGSTIEEIANLLRQETDDSSWSPLVQIQNHGSKPPFFCIPGGGGNVLYLYDLARHLGADQPFYGLQALGLDGESQPYTQVEEMVAYYIKAIQTVQPEGPYFLGGHSFGGWVAYEIAQQLHNQGHEVALVAILDAPAPVENDKPVYIDLDPAVKLLETVRLIERWLGKDLKISEQVLQSQEPEEQWEYLKQQLIEVGLLPSGTQTKQVRGLVQVFDANLQGSINYLPTTTYPRKITVIRAQEVNPEDADLLTELRQDVAWGWGKFSPEPVDVHEVPGDHITMMAQPHIQSVAEQLKICIEKASAGE